MLLWGKTNVYDTKGLSFHKANRLRKEKQNLKSQNLFVIPVLSRGKQTIRQWVKQKT